MRRKIYNTGLSKTELDSLSALFADYDQIEKVVLYGSRAKGQFKPFSDVDITLIGDRLTNSILNDLIVRIDDLLLPYNFDISIYSVLSNRNLIAHIGRVGIAIYDRDRDIS